MILNRDFYNRPTLKVARDLLGKTLRYGNKEGRIIETEAYLQNDAASHSSRKMAESNKVMFGPAGHAYVYFIYGMYYCLNAVTRPKNLGEAVLIRAVEPLKGLKGKTDGPGKLCRAFGIDRSLNGKDLTKGDFVIRDDGFTPAKIQRATRIGIKLNTDKLWRFYTSTSNSKI